MKLQLFNGGKATRKAPHLIGLSEAIEYRNIDNEQGPLQPVKTKLASGILVDRYNIFFEAQQEWVSSDTVKDYVEFQEKLYWADRVGQPQKYDGTNTFQLGITAPTVAATGVVTNQPAAITRASLVEDLAAGDLPATTLLTYAIVNKDTATGLDSEALFIGFTTGTGATHEITITDLDTNFADEARIYRLFDGVYRLLATFTSPTDIFLDDTFDISANAAFVTTTGNLDGTIQYMYTYYNSADGTESALSPLSAELVVSNGSIALSNITASADPQVDQKRLYRIGGGLSLFSLVTTLPNATTTYNDNLAVDQIDGAVNDSADHNIPLSGLQFLIEANSSLFGVLGQRVYYTEIGLPDAWPTLNFIDFPVDVLGIGDTANGVLVFTKFITYIITGTSPSTYSKYLLSGDQGCIAFESIANLGASLLWASTDGICVSSGDQVKVITKDQLGKLLLSPVASTVHDEVYYVSETGGNIFALDFRYGNVAKEFSLGVETVVSANDTLYGWLAGELYELFAGPTNEAIEYVSPDIVEGEYSNLKTYDEFYVRYNGLIVIEILIDNVTVLTKSLTGAEPVKQLKVPQLKQQGYRVSFKVTGTGTVFEITNTPMGRQK